MVILAFAVTAGHPPLAAIEFVTVYVPGALVAKLTSPVAAETKTNPAGEEVNVPATPPPLKVGDGFAAV